MKITALCGGVGSARMLVGLQHLGSDLAAVVNVADDDRMRGLHVSPDIDTILYHLAGLTDWDRGWGVKDDSATANARFSRLAKALEDPRLQDWFTLTDTDIATHMLRSRLLDLGESLTAATEALRRAFGVQPAVMPVTDDRVRTRVVTAEGESLGFQEYFVQRQHRPDVAEVTFEGIGESTASPFAVAALRSADLILLPPSNPVLSVAPVLEVPGIAFRIRQAKVPRVGVSPIIASGAVKGPTATLLGLRGVEVSCVGVASMYQGLLTHWVIDTRDADRAGEVEQYGMTPIVVDTMMSSPERSREMCDRILEQL